MGVESRDSCLAKGASGFTLIELMMVITVVAIIATIGIINYLNSKARAGEGAVIQWMRNIHTAQQLVRQNRLIDLNADDAPEYGFLGELSGNAPIRGTSTVIDPPVLSSGTVSIDATGTTFRHGYIFRLYLPDSTGVGVPEIAALLPTVDPDNATNYYTLLAWPTQYGATGQRSFFLNQSGDILRCFDSSYSGTSGAPPPNAALVGVPVGVITTHSLAGSGIAGVDGNIWAAVH